VQQHALLVGIAQIGFDQAEIETRSLRFFGGIWRLGHSQTLPVRCPLRKSLGRDGQVDGIVRRDPGALKLLDRARFVVPADWHARAADEYRYIINFSFELFPLEAPVPRSFSAPLPFEGEEWVRIARTTVGAGWVTRGDEGIHGKLVE